MQDIKKKKKKFKTLEVESEDVPTIFLIKQK